jgi:hypothetical protein
VPSECEFDKICSGVFPPKSSTFDPYRDRSEDANELRVFVALVDAGVLEVIGKGPDSIRCFDCASPDETWARYTSAARTGSVELIARRLQLPASAVIRDLFDGSVAGLYELTAAPRKALFYRHVVPVESKRKLILGDFERIRAARLAKLDGFVNVITGPNPEARIYDVLVFDAVVRV